MTLLPPPAGLDDGTQPEALQVSGLGRNATWLYVDSLTSILGGIFLLGFSFRRLGASEYGLYALVTTVLAVFGTVDFGLKLFVIRATARDSESFAEEERIQARRDVETAYSTYTVWGLFVLAATGISMFMVANSHSNFFAGEHVPLLVFLVGFSSALQLSTASFAGIAAGRNQFQVASIGGLAGTGVRIAIVVTTISHLNLVALGAASLASVLVSQGYCGWWVRRHEPWFHRLPRPVS